MVLGALLLPTPATAQPEGGLSLVVVEPERGSATILGGPDLLELRTDLIRPVVVVSDPASDRLVIGQAGPADGLASIVELVPDGQRRTLAWGLAGIADIAVDDRGRVLFVTGTDGAVRVADGGGSPPELVRVSGQAVGLALASERRLVVVARGSGATLVDIDSWTVLGVLPSSGDGRPVTLVDQSSVCIPSSAVGGVVCAPFAGGLGVELGGLAGVLALAAPQAADQLLVVQPDQVVLLEVATRRILQRWALAAADVDVLRSTAAWLGLDPLLPTGPAAPTASPAQVDLWLLIVGVVAGLAAIALALGTRRPGVRRATRTRDVEGADVDV